MTDYNLRLHVRPLVIETARGAWTACASGLITILPFALRRVCPLSGRNFVRMEDCYWPPAAEFAAPDLPFRPI